MSLQGYIARQPIVTNGDRIYGYELLFRTVSTDGSIVTDIEDSMFATANVAVNTLNHIGINSLVGEGFAFINIDKSLLLDDIILGIPKERFVLELVENIEVDDAVVERIKELRNNGYRMALDNATCETAFVEKFASILPYISIIKLDVSNIDKADVDGYMDQFKQFDVTFLASKVETKKQFEFFNSIGCQLFQGYFFAKPDIIEGKILDPAFKSIFKLINLLGKDAGIDEISTEFEASPEITLQLLKFMNSGQLPLKQKIRSIAHAIALLGKDPLKYWLLLIAFARSNDSDEVIFDSPLLVLAQTRSTLMSEMMKRLSTDRSTSHEAALVGTLSLIDVITKTSMETILAELDMAESIELALLKRKGDLGILLELAVAMEEFDFQLANTLLKKLDMTHEVFQEILMNSYGS